MPAGAMLEYNLYDQLASDLEGKVGQIVLTTALNIALRANERMARPKHGRVYRIGSYRKYVKVGGKMWTSLKKAGLRSGKNAKGKQYIITGAKMHRASAPGEAPAVDTGHLTNSVRVRMLGPTVAETTFTAEYAAALEFGGAHTAPRPFLDPSAKEEWPLFWAALEKLLG